MDNMDQNTQQQVWQRVFARPVEAQGDDLRKLLMAAMEQAAGYRSLMGVLTGRSKERAKGLYEGQLSTISCLKGIGVLSGKGEEVLKIWDPAREPVKKLLEKSYHRSRRAMIEYTSRSADTEFGVVFQRLAEREGKQCTLIAELLGMK